MASFTGIIKTLQDLTAQTTAEDTDLIPIGTSVLKKITFANLRKALGVDALNSNIQNLKDSISGIYTANLSVPNITIDGTVYTGTTEIVYLRIKNTADTRAILIGIAVGASDGAVWSKYVTTNKILIRKVNDGTWTNWTSI